MEKTKICIGICGLEKPLFEFETRKDSKDGYRNQCKECMGKGVPKEIFKKGFKRCVGGKIHCNEIKPLSEFPKLSTCNDGHINQCNICIKKYN